MKRLPYQLSILLFRKDMVFYDFRCPCLHIYFKFVELAWKCLPVNIKAPFVSYIFMLAKKRRRKKKWFHTSVMKRRINVKIRNNKYWEWVYFSDRVQTLSYGTRKTCLGLDQSRQLILMIGDTDLRQSPLKRIKGLKKRYNQITGTNVTKY